MKIICIIAIIFSLASNLFGQDSINISNRFVFSWAAYGYYVHKQEQQAMLLPEIIKKNRFISSPMDNPLYHGASAFELGLSSELIKNYKFHITLVSEHRGVSYGVFNTKSMIVYPILKISFTDTLRFANQKWVISGIGGQERNFKDGEGLYLYNLNCHANRLNLQVNKNISLGLLHIGDLTNGIGLNIDDLLQINIIFNKKKQKAFNLALMLSRWKLYTNNFIYVPELSTSFMPNQNTKLYSHFGFKNLTNAYKVDSTHYHAATTTEKMAGVIGITHQQRSKKFNMEATAEIRFYGKAFNFGHSRTVNYFTSLYRSSRSYNSTIGENLYPLSSYDNPFSQWGVFTEYNHLNIGALTLTAKGNLKLINQWHLYFDADYNAIHAENERPFHYFFATFGLNYKFRSDIDCGLGITNKGMNLDTFYPTFYFFPKFNGTILLKKKF